MSLTVNQFQPKVLYGTKSQSQEVNEPEEQPITHNAEDGSPRVKYTTSIDSFLDELEGSNSNTTIFQSLIFRTPDGTLIVPDDVYNAIGNYNGSDAYDFANQAASDTNDQNEMNYYVSWFMLVQQEQGINYCIAASDFGIDLNDSDTLSQLLLSNKINAEEVTINSNGKIVVNSYLDNRTNIDKFKDIVKGAIEEIKEYKNQFKYYINQEDYEDIKTRLTALEELVNEMYSEAINEIENSDINAINNIDNKYNSFVSLLQNVNAQIDMNYKISQDWGDTTPPEEDNDKSIDEIIAILEQEITEMFSNVSSVDTESEYKEFQKKLVCLNTRLYAAYIRELDNASENLQKIHGLLSGIENKYNIGLELLHKADITLEGLYVNGDVESLNARQEVANLEKLAYEIINKAENAYYLNLTYEECIELMEQLKDVQEKINGLFSLSVRGIDSSKIDEIQSDNNALTERIKNAYAKLDSISQLLPSVKDEDRSSSFDEIINVLISDLTVYNNLGYVSSSSYKMLTKKLSDIGNRAMFALSRELDFAGKNPVDDIVAKYNDFMDNYYNKAGKKLENAYNKSCKLGKFNSLLLNYRTNSGL